MEGSDIRDIIKRTKEFKYVAIGTKIIEDVDQDKIRLKMFHVEETFSGQINVFALVNKEMKENEV